jgi:Na+/H+-dicarboxylate symporter
MLPLGYSLGWKYDVHDFASIFIAQAHGIHLLGTQMTMLLVLMLTSKGIAGYQERV